MKRTESDTDLKKSCSFFDFNGNQLCQSNPSFFATSHPDVVSCLFFFWIISHPGNCQEDEDDDLVSLLVQKISLVTDLDNGARNVGLSVGWNRGRGLRGKARRPRGRTAPTDRFWTTASVSVYVHELNKSLTSAPTSGATVRMSHVGSLHHFSTQLLTLFFISP